MPKLGMTMEEGTVVAWLVELHGRETPEQLSSDEIPAQERELLEALGYGADARSD